MQDLTRIGIDTGKHGFHVHGQDRHGKALLRRKFDCKHRIPIFANFQPSTTVMEARAGAHSMAAAVGSLPRGRPVVHRCVL